MLLQKFNEARNFSKRLLATFSDRHLRVLSYFWFQGILHHKCWIQRAKAAKIGTFSQEYSRTLLHQSQYFQEEQGCEWKLETLNCKTFIIWLQFKLVDYYSLRKYYERDTAYLGLIDSFIQDAPQLVLQLYILSVRNQTISNSTGKIIT